MFKWIHPQAIIMPLLVVFTMWICFGLQWLGVLHTDLGIIPWKVSQLKGVIFSPLLHGGLSHIINNSFTLLILLFLSFQVYPKLSYIVLVMGWLISGFMVWLFPNFMLHPGYYNTVHIGASGLVYVFAFFLFTIGILRNDRKLLAISLLTAFAYGSLVWGVLPNELFPRENGHQISWQSHLSGAITGVFLAFVLKNTFQKPTQDPSWKKSKYNSSTDDALWEEYNALLEEHELHQEETPEQKKKTWDDLL